MTARQKTRLLAALAIGCGAAATVFLTAAAFRQNMLFFYTPSQLAADLPDDDFRLGGLVGRVLPKDGSLETRFVVTDNSVSLTVSYRGVLPDLFRQGQGVVVRGKWQSEKDGGGIVRAGEVLAKHDENYMPPPLRDLRPEK